MKDVEPNQHPETITGSSLNSPRPVSDSWTPEPWSSRLPSAHSTPEQPVDVAVDDPHHEDEDHDGEDELVLAATEWRIDDLDINAPVLSLIADGITIEIPLDEPFQEGLITAIDTYAANAIDDELDTSSPENRGLLNDIAGVSGWTSLSRAWDQIPLPLRVALAGLVVILLFALIQTVT